MHRHLTRITMVELEPQFWCFCRASAAVVVETFKNMAGGRGMLQCNTAVVVSSVVPKKSHCQMDMHEPVQLELEVRTKSVKVARSALPVACQAMFQVHGARFRGILSYILFNSHAFAPGERHS